MRIIKPEELKELNTLDAEVIYPGHVAICIGNGKIVEASVHNEHEIKVSFEVSPLYAAQKLYSEIANRVECLFKDAGYQVCHTISLYGTFEEGIKKIEIEYTIKW